MIEVPLEQNDFVEILLACCHSELNKISILPTRNWDKLSNLKVILYKNEEIINGNK